MIRLLVLTLLGGLTSLYSASFARAGTLLQVEGHLMRWASENPDATTVITYSILTEPYNVQSGRSILSPSNCAKMHAFADILTASRGISEANAKAELRAALNAWEQAANIVFAEVSDPHLANIVIGAADDPGAQASTVLQHFDSAWATLESAKWLS